MDQWSGSLETNGDEESGITFTMSISPGTIIPTDIWFKTLTFRVTESES